LIQDSAGRLIRLWAEPLVAVTLLIMLITFMINDLRVSGWFIALASIVGLALMVWVVNAIARARLRSTSDGKGVVLIDEGRIGHFGPDVGGFVDIDALSRVQVAGATDARTWILTHLDGPPLSIPTRARDADQLVDFLASLDGVSPLRIHAAIASEETETVWQREET